MTRRERRRQRDEDARLVDVLFGHVEQRRVVPAWLAGLLFLGTGFMSLLWASAKLDAARDMRPEVAPVRMEEVGDVDMDAVARCLSDAARGPIIMQVEPYFPEGDPFPLLASNYNEVPDDRALDACTPASPVWSGPLHAEGCPR